MSIKSFCGELKDTSSKECSLALSYSLSVSSDAEKKAKLIETDLFFALRKHSTSTY